MHTGLGAEGSPLHELSFSVCQRVLAERRLGKIPMNCRQILKAKFIGAMGAVPKTCFLHEYPPKTLRPASALLAGTPQLPAVPLGWYVDHYTAGSAGARPIVQHCSACQAKHFFTVINRRKLLVHQLLVHRSVVSLVGRLNDHQKNH